MADTKMLTFLGKELDLSDIDPEKIHIVDIAHSLSMLCRYGGHVSRFYSVAQHSVLVSTLVDEKYAGDALLHDAAEAYTGDLIRPIRKYLKRQTMEFENIQYKIQRIINKKYGLCLEMPDEVMRFDNAVVASEIDQLYGKTDRSEPEIKIKIETQTPEEAKHRFLVRFFDLRRRGLIKQEQEMSDGSDEGDGRWVKKHKEH